MAAGDLEARIREIEDRLEIYNLIASHPPSADTGARDYTASGVDRGRRVRPRRRVRRAQGDGWRSPELRTIRASSRDRAGHRPFRGLPYVRVTGDTAYAISYLQILVPDRVGPEFDVPNHGKTRGFHVHRVSANRWDFVRTAQGWKIKRRRLRPLDGSEPARDILRGTFGVGRIREAQSAGGICSRDWRNTLRSSALRH